MRIFNKSNINNRVDNLHLLHAKVLQVASLFKKKLLILSRHINKDKDNLTNVKEELVSINKTNSRCKDLITLYFIVAFLNI